MLIHTIFLYTSDFYKEKHLLLLINSYNNNNAYAFKFNIPVTRVRETDHHALEVHHKDNNLICYRIIRK